MKKKHIFAKTILSIIYLIAIAILGFSAYKVFQNEKRIKSWEDVKNVDEYSYIEKSKESFSPDIKAWHTYLIAINESEYNKYKDIIDYTYNRTTKEVKPIKVYGYPVIINDELKELAIKNFPNFVPKENQVKITDENFEEYLTNSYLDTTLQRVDKFNPLLFLLLLLIFVSFGLLIYTIFGKEKV